MISVHIERSGNTYRSLFCDGHALYDKKGRDIVCAAVSMLIINTLNAIEQFTRDDMTVSADEKIGRIEAVFGGKMSHDAKLLMDALLLGLTETEKTYGNKYLTLTIKEV